MPNSKQKLPCARATAKGIHPHQSRFPVHPGKTLSLKPREVKLQARREAPLCLRKGWLLAAQKAIFLGVRALELATTAPTALASVGSKAGIGFFGSQTANCWFMMTGAGCR